MSTWLVVLVVLASVAVYATGWVATALALIENSPEQDRWSIDHPADRVIVAAAWPIIWPGILAWVIHQRRDEANRLERIVSARLAEEHDTRDRAIAALEHELGLGPSELCRNPPKPTLPDPGRRRGRPGPRL